MALYGISIAIAVILGTGLAGPLTRGGTYERLFFLLAVLLVVGFAGSLGSSISWLFVHPNHRRKGVARALVRELIARLDGPITLNVATINTAARNLYETIGFVVEREFLGEFKGYMC